MNNFPPNVSQFQEFAKNFKWKGYAGFMAYPFPVNGMNYPKVASVDPKGGASRAGLKVDDVIVSINEIQTNNVPFIKFLRELEVFPGDVLSIVVWRGEDKYKTLKIKTTQRPQ
jgi:S1-C subfamily serine protease